MRTLVNPTVIVEILSDSTERYDRTTKFDHYRKIPSLRDYLLVSQREPRVEHFAKSPDGSWTHQACVGIEAVVELRSMGVALRLADIYARVAFVPLG